MTALKKTQPARSSAPKKAAPEVRAVVDGLKVEPVASPAHDLQKALHEAGYYSEATPERSLSNGMMVLSLVCVYAISMLMLFGSMTA
jgi:hypothetical protein